MRDSGKRTLSHIAPRTVLLGLLLGAGLGATVVGAEAQRPNILFIMTDQHRWDCLGANGNELIQTPHLDALASDGANFTHFFVQAPVCVPSRVSFFTGRYPHSHKNRVNYTPLDRSEVLMQARLREVGYQTASVGKLHYHPPTAAEAKRTGFDFVELHDAVSPLDPFSDYVAWRKQHDPQAHIGYRALAKNVPDGKNPFRQAIDEQFTETSWVGLRTRHYIRQMTDDDQPFFLFCSFWKPHAPFEVPQPFDSLYDGVEIPLPDPVTLEEIMRLPVPLRLLILRGRPAYDTDRTRLQWMYRSYYGAISHIDREVGRILAALAEAGVAENTIVVFSSDHGDQLLEHGLMGKNCFFEASVRVPFILRWPGQIRPGQHEELVESVDLVPTLFELAGLSGAVFQPGPQPRAAHYRVGSAVPSPAGGLQRERDPRSHHQRAPRLSVRQRRGNQWGAASGRENGPHTPLEVRLLSRRRRGAVRPSGRRRRTKQPRRAGRVRRRRTGHEGPPAALVDDRRRSGSDRPPLAQAAACPRLRSATAPGASRPPGETRRQPAVRRGPGLVLRR